MEARARALTQHMEEHIQLCPKEGEKKRERIYNKDEVRRGGRPFILFRFSLLFLLLQRHFLFPIIQSIGCIRG